MKNILLGMILSASAVSAFAAPVTTTITIQGADYLEIHMDEPIWSPSARLVVSFTGEDLNNDQTITANELTHLEGYDRTYLPQEMPEDILAFRFRSATDYMIGAGYSSPHGYFSESFYLSSSDPNYRNWGWSNDAYMGERWYITDRSTITIVSSVPEPSGIAMSALGLGLMGLIARRRQRAAQR